MYRRSIGTASCMMGDFVAEIGVSRPICHTGASDSIPGLVPRRLDSGSYESGHSAGGRTGREWTVAATKVDKAPVRAQDALRKGFEVVIPVPQSPLAASAGDQSEEPRPDAWGNTDRFGRSFGLGCAARAGASPAAHRSIPSAGPSQPAPRRGRRSVWGGRARVANGALHGRACRQSIQPGTPSVLSAAIGGGETEEAGSDGPHAKVADNAQCDGEVGSALDSPGGFDLTSKTVA